MDQDVTVQNSPLNDSIEYRDDEALRVPIECVSINPHNARSSFNEQKIDELAQSLREHGMLQPLVVREIRLDNSQQRNFEVIAGDTRLLAARKAGLQSVPVRLQNVDDATAHVLNLVENIHREDLNILDQARAIRELMTRENLSFQKVAERLNKTKSWVQMRLDVMRFAEQYPEIEDMIYERPDSQNAARKLGLIKNGEMRRWGVEQFKAGKAWDEVEKEISQRLACEHESGASAEFSNEKPFTSRRIHAAEHIYGPPLSFRGLQHAPINELGVVFLFGMVAKELGFIAESVRSAFPDCEAKRYTVGPKKGVDWSKGRSVRIEFEFKSRNFLEHKHDSNQCDLIVCWEHNWLECPVEVLELKSKIKKLKSNA